MDIFVPLVETGEEFNCPIIIFVLSPVSSRNLKLRNRDLRCVAKRTRKFPRKNSQVARKNHFKATGLVPRGQYPAFHW